MRPRPRRAEPGVHAARPHLRTPDLEPPVLVPQSRGTTALAPRAIHVLAAGGFTGCERSCVLCDVRSFPSPRTHHDIDPPPVVPPSHRRLHRLVSQRAGSELRQSIELHVDRFRERNSDRNRGSQRRHKARRSRWALAFILPPSTLNSGSEAVSPTLTQRGALSPGRPPCRRSAQLLQHEPTFRLATRLVRRLARLHSPSTWR